MTTQQRPWTLFVDLNRTGLPGAVSVLGGRSTVGIVHVRTILSAFQLLTRADRRLIAIFVDRRPGDPLAEQLYGEVRRLAPWADLYELSRGESGSPSAHAKQVRSSEVPEILERYSALHQ